MQDRSSHQDFATEHQIFWMLVKKAARRDDVGRVYLAIQAAIAFGRETVDVGPLMVALMAEGQGSPRVASEEEGIGAGGLAYFFWLYEVELTAAGEADTHHYRFRRRYDGAQVIASLQTARGPLSLQFQQVYERERRRLEQKRAGFLPGYRWYATTELFERYRAGAASQGAVTERGTDPSSQERNQTK